MKEKESLMGLSTLRSDQVQTYVCKWEYGGAECANFSNVVKILIEEKSI